MSERVRIFVASASESMHVAEAFAAVLPVTHYEVRHWPDAFNPNEVAPDDLQRAARQCEFAVFVFGPDDELNSRGESSMAPRDNVIFELGLFAASLGRKRTYVLTPADASVKIPSDLLGLGYATYMPPDAPPDDQRWESAVRTAARVIRRSIEQQGRQGPPADEWSASGAGRSNGQRVIRLAVSGGDHLELFRIVDGGLEHAWHWGNWSDWRAMSTPQPVREVAVGSHDGYMDLFVVSDSGTLWHRWWGPHESWSDWENWGSAAGPIAVASAGSGHLEVFYQHAGRIMHRWYTNNEWSEPTPFH